MVLPSLEDDLGGADSLEGDNIEERLRLALVDQHSAIPASPRETPLYRPSESRQELGSQDNAGCHISRDRSREPSRPTLDVLDKDDEKETQEQHQKVGQEQQRERSSNSGGDGDGGDDCW